ncbi:hypothetical protein JOC36_000197 [Weissella uvarum]|uniref:hypothetical protein n=1 Tax=Weissella uvarum TaxID=1479233 RepID=UPI0030B80F4B|nr:hypothetical protein [Weissella uvarum]
MELLNEYIEAYLSTLRYLDEVIAEPADEYGLSFEQYLIMNQVAKEDGITLSAIVNNR